MKVIDVAKHKYTVRRVESVSDLFLGGPVSLIEEVTLKNFDKLENEGDRVFSHYGDNVASDGCAGVLEDGRILVLNVRLSHFAGTFASHDDITVASFLLTPLRFS